MIEKIRNEIKNTSFNKVKLSNKHTDGRINSAIDEEVIFNELKNRNVFLKNKIYKSNKERNWYDFCINFKNKNDEEIFIPVNIKIIQGNKNDNLNCKLGLYYSLTGKIPSFQNEIGWKEYFLKLKENMGENYNDYYFLVINKTDLTANFIGLREINKLIPNGNNVPFQCNFNSKENKFINNKKYDDDRKRLLNVFYESIKKRTTIRDYFEGNFVKNGKIE